MAPTVEECKATNRAIERTAQMRLAMQGGVGPDHYLRRGPLRVGYDYNPRALCAAARALGLAASRHLCLRRFNAPVRLKNVVQLNTGLCKPGSSTRSPAWVAQARQRQSNTGLRS